MSDEAAKELYGLVRDIKAEMAAQTVILQRMEKELADKEKRIKDLELKDARRGGIMATIAIVASALGSAFCWIIKSLFGVGQ
ncbi:MAG: hypothetical protein IKO72_12265 [Kiritimatiellae bacterium]|nr:hypothetical protein [Kiritimatiellia bacterium]